MNHLILSSCESIKVNLCEHSYVIAIRKYSINGFCQQVQLDFVRYQIVAPFGTFIVILVVYINV